MLLWELTDLFWGDMPSNPIHRTQLSRRLWCKTRRTCPRIVTEETTVPGEWVDNAVLYCHHWIVQKSGSRLVKPHDLVQVSFTSRSQPCKLDMRAGTSLALICRAAPDIAGLCWPSYRSAAMLVSEAMGLWPWSISLEGLAGHLCCAPSVWFLYLIEPSGFLHLRIRIEWFSTNNDKNNLRGLWALPLYKTPWIINDPS